MECIKHARMKMRLALPGNQKGVLYLYRQPGWIGNGKNNLKHTICQKKAKYI